MVRHGNAGKRPLFLIRYYFKPAPNATLTPKCSNKNIKSIYKKLKIMCINCDSLRSVDKHAELNCLVNHHNPHVMLGQESRLTPYVPSCEVFPKGSEFSAGIESWAVVASSSQSEKTLTMLRMLFQMTIWTVRVSGSNLSCSMHNY